MLAYQIRALRERDSWTQAQFAEKVGIKHPNNVSARLENPQYGKHTLTTLKKIAAACDVGLVVWFVPFSRLVDWATGTPHLDEGLRPGFYNVPEFDKDQLPGAIPDAAIKPEEVVLSGAGSSTMEPELRQQPLGERPSPVDEDAFGSVKTRWPKGEQQQPMEGVYV